MLKKFRVIIITITISITSLFVGCASDLSSVQDTNLQNYVVNKRTGKVHSPSCTYVERMSEKNKLFTSDTLLDLLKQDYVICRRCRAGISNSSSSSVIHRFLHSNLYGDNIDITASLDDYLTAVDETSEWYVSHVPTYASKIQDEPFIKYNGALKNYTEYSMRNKGKTSVHRVITKDTSASSTSLLKSDDQILRGTEEAASNYIDNFNRINFKSRIAYYPCDFLDDESDYNTPGDDCVRYLFAVFNRMDSQFTKKYAALTNTTYSKTNSASMATDYQDIAYGFINLGFKIYDVKEGIVDVDNDTIPEGYIFKIDENFTLSKGDILAREGHVHIYLGDGLTAEAENFGWGRVYRSYPQKYNIQIENNNGESCIALTNGSGDKEYYRRVYRYLGTSGGH